MVESPLPSRNSYKLMPRLWAPEKAAWCWSGCCERIFSRQVRAAGVSTGKTSRGTLRRAGMSLRSWLREALFFDLVVGQATS